MLQAWPGKHVNKWAQMAPNHAQYRKQLSTRRRYPVEFAPNDFIEYASDTVTFSHEPGWASTDDNHTHTHTHYETENINCNG